MAKNSHGMHQSPEWNAWIAMKQRCFNPNHKRYSYYGGRGITISDRWKNSFTNFFADMGLKPSPKHSIDRIDNDGNYSAENCRWATPKEQANNQRSNRLITIGCVTLNVTQWAREMGFNTGVIYTRLKLGWSERDAILTPVETVKPINKKIC